jgi:hypothetical protein
LGYALGFLRLTCLEHNVCFEIFCDNRQWLLNRFGCCSTRQGIETSASLALDQLRGSEVHVSEPTPESIMGFGELFGRNLGSLPVVLQHGDLPFFQRQLMK